MTRKALGRGLSALIRESEAPATATMAEPEAAVAVELIDANPFQPRTSFDETELSELSESVRAKGIIQPVLVRPVGERYQLVAGERRWRAAKLAGLQTIPAVVKDLEDKEMLELALTENILRDDLGPLEAARAYRVLQDRFGESQEEIAARLGINRVTVTNSLRLLRLPAKIHQMIEQKELTAGHARALLSVPDEAEQLRLAERIASRGLSVREAERITSERARQDPGAPAAEAPQPRQDANVREAVLNLERMLGTRVKITGDGEKGKIEISYFSAEDLNRLYEQLVKAFTGSSI
jgi:ParB family transcriptional regulator, chromosome partitioning protein